VNRRRTTWGLIALGAAAAVAAVAVGLRWAHGGLPGRSGEARVPGLSAPVAVRYDEWGVPHVKAASAVDLAAAAGWVQANDRMFQMELMRRAASGRLSELVGAAALELDRGARELRLRRSAERTLAVLGDESLALLEAYARGVNAWLAERGSDLPPELRLLGVRPEPWTPVDSLCTHFLMARDLTYPRRYEERRWLWLTELGPERTLELIGDPSSSVPAQTAALAARAAAGGGDRRAGGGNGSNSWAVGASRSATGHPIVSNDPHLGLALPGFWYQATLRAPDYEAAGMMLPGMPMIVIGQSAHLAWAFTNVEADFTDLFLEQLSEDGASVRRGETWLPIEVERETIAVQDGEPVELELLATDIGPLFPGTGALPPRSLAWTAYVPFDPVAVFLGLARARDLAEVDAAVEPYVCPPQNLVVGTRAGDLLFTILGRMPERGRGDGRLPAPGWDASWHWRGLQPFAANPRVERPAEDLLVTANNDLRPQGYEGTLTGDYASPHRARRIRELLLARETWDVADMLAVQTDHVSLYAREVVEHLRAPIADLSPRAAAARDALLAWDGEMSAEGVSALFALFDHYLDRTVFDELDGIGYPERIPALLAALSGELPDWLEDRDEALGLALERAWDAGSRRWGEDPRTWKYDAAHWWRADHVMGDLPVIGPLFSRGPYGVPGSDTTVGVFTGHWFSGDVVVTHGASMRWIADTADPDRSLAVLPVGQSGHPFDPHYDDQVRPYLAGEARPVHWSEAAIEESAVSTLTLIP